MVKDIKSIVLGTVSTLVLVCGGLYMGVQAARIYESDMGHWYKEQMRTTMPISALTHCYGTSADKSTVNIQSIQNVLAQTANDSAFEVRLTQCFGTWWYQKEASLWVQEQDKQVRQSITELMQNNPAWWSVFVDPQRVELLWQDQEGALYDNSFAQLADQNIWHQVMWLQLWAHYFGQNNIEHPLPRLSEGTKQRHALVVQKLKEHMQGQVDDGSKGLLKGQAHTIANTLYAFEFPVKMWQQQALEIKIQQIRSKGEPVDEAQQKQWQDLVTERQEWIRGTFGLQAP